MNFTFLVTYYAHYELLDICLDSIRRYYPSAKIIVSQQIGDEAVNVGDAKLIYHNMGEIQWAGVAQGLMRECDTEYGIFIEHDAFLCKPLDDLLAKMTRYNLIGVEEVIPGLRNAPGFANQNFFILNIKKMKELGLNNVRIKNPDELEKNGLKHVESGYGITQTFNNSKMFLPVTMSGYAYGTLYGDYVHHLWYGSYRKRDTMIYDNVPQVWLEEEANRLITDYWDNRL